MSSVRRKPRSSIIEPLQSMEMGRVAFAKVRTLRRDREEEFSHRPVCQIGNWPKPRPIFRLVRGSFSRPTRASYVLDAVDPFRPGRDHHTTRPWEWLAGPG